SALDVRKNLKKFSEDFIEEKFHDIKDFNVIPGSTIFLEGKWENIKVATLEDKLKKLIVTFKFKKINIVCINKKTIELFWDYIKK
ncbi:unnamed protein product, partial [marine sediment metagenome]